MKVCCRHLQQNHTDQNLVSMSQESDEINLNTIDGIKIQSKKLIKLVDLEKIIKANSQELEIMKNRIEENRYILKSQMSAWYPNLNLSSTGFPQYIEGNTYNDLSSNTSSNQ